MYKVVILQICCHFILIFIASPLEKGDAMMDWMHGLLFSPYRCRLRHLTEILPVQDHDRAGDSLVVRASDSRPEGLVPCLNWGGGIAIYRPFGEFRRANSYCHLYGVQGQRQAYFRPFVLTDAQFRGPRSDYVR
ncbi:hypothetical protein TNCV_2806661 [Trichonephila clavipes]|nr:hypothetical protein TNCV_2806661 [Trichonephila clavipes]